MNLLIEQITDFFITYAWPFIEENKALLIGLWGAIAATLAAYWTRELLRPKAKPRIVEPKININKSEFRPYNAVTGSFIAVNDGPKPCNLQNVKVLATDLIFNVDAVAEKMVFGLMDVGRRGGELPILIMGYEQKTVSFRGTHNIKDDVLPESLNLEVKFNCKAIQQELKRIGNTREYK